MNASRLCSSYIVAVLLAIFLVVSCGQKGPLYLPDEQKHPVKNNTIPIPASVTKEEDKNRNKEDPKAP